MLQTQTLETGTLELLKSLQAKDYLSNFNLAGGTALSLFFGHRKSIDLDLFTNHGFDSGQLLENLQQDYPIQLFFTAASTIKGCIDKVNVDFIAHRYPNVKPPVTSQGVTLFSQEDILAMKMNAISASGQRSKDFVDIYFALKHFSLREILGFYCEKYRQHDSTHVLKSLVYFDDVDLSDWPMMLKQPKLKWTTVKNTIEKVVLDFIKQGCPDQ
jgi:hypothetical protein